MGTLTAENGQEGAIGPDPVPLPPDAVEARSGAIPAKENR